MDTSNKLKTLYILSSKNEWTPVDINSNKYSDMYRAIKNTLDKYQGKGSDIDTTVENRIIYESYPFLIKLQKVESHRLCTVLCCLQFDLSTNGLRYLVYGTKYNLDSTYGIGTCLESIDTTYMDKWCPVDVTAKYI